MRGFDPSRQTHRPEMLRSLMAAFLRILPSMILGMEATAAFVFLLFRRLEGAAPAGLWFGAISADLAAWLLMARRDRTAGAKGRNPGFAPHALLAGLSAALFSSALLWLFLKSEGAERTLLAVFSLGFFTSGVFVASMPPPLVIAWTSVWTVGSAAAICVQGGPFMLASLALFGIYVAFLAFIGVHYFRVYKERFAFQMEAEYQKRELATMLEQSPLSIVITDSSGAIIQCNKRMEALSGFSAEELLGMNPRALKSGKTPPERYKELWETIRSGNSWVGEFINRDKAGREYVERASISPITDAAGRVVRYMAIKEDVTLQKEYEERLAKQNEFIRLLLRDFEEKASDWMWELDASLSLSYLSSKLLKAPWAEGIIGRSMVRFVQERLPAGDAEAERLAEALAADLAAGVPIDNRELKLEFSGSVRWIMLSAIPVERDLETGSAWRGVGRDITDRKTLERQLYRQANYDEKTGLPNRFWFRDALNRILENAEPGLTGVLGVLRLGGLDLLRTNLGTAAHDETLSRFIRLFVSRFGEGAKLSRLNKDEFVFWLADADMHAIEALHAFARTVNDPYDEQGERPASGESRPVSGGGLDVRIGLAFYPDDAQDKSGLLHAADLALNGSAPNQLRKVTRYQEKLAEDFTRRTTLIQDFAESFAAGRFFMVYQPQVSASGLGLEGAEALVRWRHPVFGLVPPGEFIPLAERSGFIVALGEWTLRQACADAAAWKKPVSVSVNVSGVQLHTARRLRRAVERALEESGLEAGRLVLEITESAMLMVEDDLGKCMAEMRDLGITVALDDFGTGYSSLAYIRRLRLDKLKIDQSFVRALDGDASAGRIVEIIVELAKSLGLGTVAEGVETESQALALRRMGCDSFQGYYFGKPMPQEEFLELLEDGGR